jgi:hypothetical protein
VRRTSLQFPLVSQSSWCATVKLTVISSVLFGAP